MSAVFHGETGTHCLGIQIKAAWSCSAPRSRPAPLATARSDLVLPFAHNARLGSGWGELCKNGTSNRKSWYSLPKSAFLLPS